MSFSLDGSLVMAGAGKMGGALISGWLARGLDPATLIIQDPAPPPEVRTLLTRHGIRHASSIGPLDRAPAVIILAVKPQLMDQVLPPLGALAGPRTLVLSIAAGRAIASFERHLAAGTPVVRAMPNTPAAIGRGITVCVPNGSVGPGERAITNQLLSAVGTVAWVENEALLDPVTAVSGSGPAYVFLLAECLAAAGIAQGLDAALAHQLARETIAGAGELMRQSPLDAATLRDNVTSPGGTTAAALAVLMSDNGLARLINEAVAAATARGRELAK